MSFLRNSTFNFIGGVLPAVALFVTIPVIVHRLGVDSYGALALITSIVGYFGILDVNVTAGSVKYVAEHQARGENTEVSRVVSFGLLLYLAIGTLGGLALWFSAEHLVGSIFKIGAAARNEVFQAIRWSAPAFFVGQLQIYLQSVPQALGRFDLSGKLDSVFGTLAPVATVLVVLAGGHLTEIVIARFAISVVHCAVLVLVLRRLLPGFRLSWPDVGVMRKVGSFSAFTYLQRIAGVTYQNADKLLIGASQSMASLATYIIPYTLISRIYGMLFRLLQGMFPLASALAAAQDFRGLQERYVYVMRYTYYINVCVCLMASAFATELLHYWLKGAVGSDAHLILVIVAYSLLAESTTNLPSLVNDGLGHPHISGIAALSRSAAGVAAAWWALSWGGIVALALSQLVVSVLASAVFVGVVHRLSMPWRFRDVAGPAYGIGTWVLVIGTPLVALRLSSAALEPWPFAVSAAAIALLLALIGWYGVLMPEHQRQLLGLVQSRFARPLPRS